MTENDQQQTRSIKVILDHTAKEEKLQEELNKANQTIGALLTEHKKEFTETLEPKKAPESGETAPLESIQEPFRVSIDGSYVPLDFVEGKSAAEVIEKVEMLAHSGADNRGEYERILSKLTKKMVNGKLAIEFQGDSRLFLKSPLPISEFDSSEVKAQKTAYNERLKANRTNWKNMNGD